MFEFLSVIFIIAGLSVLVIIHEAGHFFSAKWFGLLVEEFGFGLPPRLWGKKIGETLYSFNWLPFGGFVKIYGENRSEQSELNPNTTKEIRIIEKELSYKLGGLFFKIQNQLGRFCREKQYGDALENILKLHNIKYKRELPVSIENRASNFIDFLIEDKIVIDLKSKNFITKDDYYQMQRYLETMNLELGLIVNFHDSHLKPKRILNSKIRIFSGNSDAFVSSGRDTSRSFSHQPVYKRALIIASGVLMNFLLGWVLISIVYMIGIPQALLVAEVKEQSIASAAGILKGDQLSDFKTVPDLVGFINKNKGREVSLNVKRDKKQVIVKVKPRLSVPEGEGNLGVFLVESGLPKLGILGSFWQGLKTALQMAETIFLGLVDLIIGVFTNISILEKFVGPVGIVNVAIETAKLGTVHFLQLLALISLNLAVFNIIPIPALDGGRLFLLLVEKVKGSPLNPKIEMAINGIGFSFLLFLILIITIKDLFTLF